MNCLQIRTQLAKESGRRDLVKPGGYADNGLNYYLNAGQRLLDSLADTPSAWRSFLHDTEAGEYQIELSGCRVVESVWRLTADGKASLVFKTIFEMRELYTDDIDNVDNGTPSYYSLLQHIAPVEYSAVAADYSGNYGDILFGQAGAAKGILIMPPADGIYTIEVYGKWFSRELSADADESWWSIVRPECLLQAARIALEMPFRNAEGMRAAVEGLRFMLTGVDHDGAMQSSIHSNRIKG